MLRRIIVSLAAAALVLTAAPAQAAAPRPNPSPDPAPVTYTACYHKRTGEIRMLLGTKCGKGWKKFTWNQTGPQGPAGPSGPSKVLKDANHVVLGTFVGMYASGLLPMYQVLDSSGGFWVYDSAGRPVSDNHQILYTDAACATAPVGHVAPAQLTAISGSGRAVQEVNNVFVAAYRWGTGPTPVTGAPLHYKDATGTCVLGIAPTTGSTVPLVAVDLPVVGTAPLTLY